MFGDPIARVAQPVGKARKIEAVVERHRAGCGGGDGGEIKDGEGRAHAGDTMVSKELSRYAKLMWNKRSFTVSLACIDVLECSTMQCRHAVIASP